MSAVALRRPTRQHIAAADRIVPLAPNGRDHHQGRADIRVGNRGTGQAVSACTRFAVQHHAGAVALRRPTRQLIPAADRIVPFAPSGRDHGRRAPHSRRGFAELADRCRRALDVGDAAGIAEGVQAIGENGRALLSRGK